MRLSNRHRARRQDAGFSLVAALVAVAITGIVALALSDLFANTFKTVKRFEMQADLVDLRTYLIARASCGSTLSAAAVKTCKETTDPIALVSNNKTSSTLIAGTKTGSTVGRYSVRASCVACDKCNAGRKILVEYAVVKGSGFGKDPLTGKTLSWTDLYDGVPFACPVPDA